MKDQAVGNSRVEKGIFRSSQSEPSCFHRCKSAICNARSSAGKTCGNEQSFPAPPVFKLEMYREGIRIPKRGVKIRCYTLGFRPRAETRILIERQRGERFLPTRCHHHHLRMHSSPRNRKTPARARMDLRLPPMTCFIWMTAPRTGPGSQIKRWRWKRASTYV